MLRQLAEVRAALDGLTEAVRADDLPALVARYERARTVRLPPERTRPVHRGFDLAGDPAEELAFVRSVGESGGHLTGCTVTGGTVTYTGLRPADAGA